VAEEIGMRGVQHPSTNKVLVAPPGVSRKECGSLPVTNVIYEGNIPGVWSYWRPNEEELKALNAGKCVRVSVIGETQPMMSVGVDGVEVPDT
jgi:hypothetical protein